MKKQLAYFLVALGLAASSAVFAQTDNTEARQSEKIFIESVDLKLKKMTPEELPDFCKKRRGRAPCPNVVGRDMRPSHFFIPDDLDRQIPHARNVRVTMYIDEITNIAIADGGAKNPLLLKFETDSDSADLQLGGPYGWGVPDPGETADEFSVHGAAFGLQVYDAIVLGACGNFDNFDIHHRASVSPVQDEGEFDGEAVLNKTGIYQVYYLVRAKDLQGGTSDFEFKGVIHAACSSANSL